MKGSRARPIGADPPWAARALAQAADQGDITLTPEEVARVLRRSPAWFYRNRRRLQTAHGFPPPAPGTLIWSGRLVLAWIRGEHKHTSAQPEEVSRRSDAEDWNARALAALPAFAQQIPPSRRKTA